MIIPACNEAASIELTIKVVESILNSPQQVVSDATGQKVFQSKIDFEPGKTYLVRVVMNEKSEVPVVVTVYRTSKVEKYWRKP